MACEPRLGLRVLAADVAREPGLVYDAVDVTRAVSRLVKATRAACELDDAKRSEKTEEAVAA